MRTSLGCAFGQTPVPCRENTPTRIFNIADRDRVYLLCVWLLSALLTREELITAEAFRQNVNGFHKKLSLVSQGLGLINRVVPYFTESFDKREMHPLVKRKCDLFEKSDLHH